ncbi:hypothetical protein M3Y97_01131100 [Aphelenchoides bicaudatus]|nr:hypothetical protein M3Y97_01131100 [Aphelenchoides bicaudatus]
MNANSIDFDTMFEDKGEDPEFQKKCTDDENFYSNYVKDNIQNGYSRAKIFEEVYRKLYGLSSINFVNKYNEQEIEKWINYFENSAIPQRVLDVVRPICFYFKKAERAIEARTLEYGTHYNGFTYILAKSHYKVCLLSDRYALDVKWSFDKSKPATWFLFDMWHEQKRELKVDNELLDFGKQSKLERLNAENLLYINADRWSGQTIVTDVYLLKLSVKQFRCEILDKKTVEGYFLKVIVDSADNCKFLIIGDYERAHLFYTGSVIDSKLQLGNKMRFNFKVFHSTIKFEGDTIYALGSKNLDEHGLADEEKFLPYGFMTFSIKSNQIEKSKQFFPIQTETIGHVETFLKYSSRSVWLDNKCYLLHRDDDYQRFILYFDMDTGEVNAIEEFDRAEHFNLFIQNKFLTLCAVRSSQRLFYRIPLSQKPNSLFSLALESINKKAMFLNKDEYEKYVLKRFPQKLLPFEQSL